MSGTITLVLGGARAGKSAWAERLAASSGRAVLFLATATAGDDEMAVRIAAHRAARHPAWRTVEAPLDLVSAVRAHARPGDALLVDCLTLWVSNRMLERLGRADPDALPETAWRRLEADLEADLLTDLDALLATTRTIGAAVILVSNEVGLGVVPASPLGRRYRDVLGRVNQAAARAADRVTLMVAGLPMELRPSSPLDPDAEPS